jgi:hypothetical protein
MMKTILKVGAAGLLVVGGLFALGSYQQAHPRPPRPISDFSAAEIIHMDDTHPVRQCTNGATVYRWGRSDTYVYYKPGGAFFDAGAELDRLPAGVLPQDFCA